MHAYKHTLNAHFATQTCAQVLLTLENLADRNQYVNARNTFTELLAYGTIPVVNENVSRAAAPGPGRSPKCVGRQCSSGGSSTHPSICTPGACALAAGTLCQPLPVCAFCPMLHTSSSFLAPPGHCCGAGAALRRQRHALSAGELLGGGEVTVLLPASTPSRLLLRRCLLTVAPSAAHAAAQS